MDIPKLLKECERGRMNRRQLLQALGLTATAAFSASAAPTAAAGVAASPTQTPAAGGKGFKTVAVNHISYAVADYARSRDFYVDLLGMKVVWDDTKKCAVEFGDPPNQIYITQLSQPGDQANVGHMAYSIEHFDAKVVEAELKRRGLNPECDGPYAWTTRDPDGYRIQVCARTGVVPGAASSCK